MCETAQLRSVAERTQAAEFRGAIQLRKVADGADEVDGSGSGGEQAEEGAGPAPPAELAPPVQAKESLLTAAAKARKDKPAETDAEKILKEEQDMLRAITQRTALKSVKELAKVRLRPCWKTYFCCKQVHGHFGSYEDKPKSAHNQSSRLHSKVKDMLRMQYPPALGVVRQCHLHPARKWFDSTCWGPCEETESRHIPSPAEENRITLMLRGECACIV